MSLSAYIGVTKAAGGKKKPHRFTKLITNEVSLVTSPAILSADEADAGVGLPVVKLKDRDGVIPEAIRKIINLKGEEDYHEALRRLVNVAKTRVIAETGESDVYYFAAIKIFDDYLILGDVWSDPFSSAFKAYKCTYTQNADGDFDIGDVAVVRLRFVEETEETTKRVAPLQPVNVVPALETPASGGAVVKTLKGMEVQGAVFPLTAVPGLELKDADGGLVVKIDAASQVEVGKGYVLGDDGVVRPAPVTVDAAKMASMMDTMSKMRAAGHTMDMVINPKTGEVTMKVAPGVSAPPIPIPVPQFAPMVPAAMPATPAMEDPVVKNLVAELAALKQRVNGGATPETQGAGASTYTEKNASRKQTVGLPGDAPAHGLFTKAFVGQVRPMHLGRPN